MIKNRIISKWIAVSLIMCLIVSLLPVWESKTAYAASDETILLDGTKIGNATVAADNAFRNFNVSGGGFASSAGFVQTEQDRHATIYADGTVTGSDEVNVWFEIRVKDNPLLKTIAESGDAEVVVGWELLGFDESCFLFICSDSYSKAEFYVDGTLVLGANTDHTQGEIGYTEHTAKITANSVIRIFAELEDEDVTINGLFIKFQDKIRPELTGYTFTGDGVKRTNKKGEPELYAKQGEKISLTYNFSEAVRPFGLNSGYNDHFLRHPFFTNPPGDGLPTQGLEQFLINTTYTAADFAGQPLHFPLHKDINYTYTASKYHHSGNLPVKPRMRPSDALEGMNRGPLDTSMEEKLQSADFIDAAGNRIKPISLPVKGSNDSLTEVRGKQINPFDYESKGYRVIVDAVAPKYSKVGNGIQPEVVTGATVNDLDVMDFTVQFSEDVVPRDDRDNNPYNSAQMYLLFNNGMRAYYYSQENNDNLGYITKNVRFRMVIPDGVIVEAPLLKVLALTHDRKDAQYPADSQFLAKDKDVIQDYAGNLLIQPANYEGVHVDGDSSNVNSKIDWARFSVDNTKPLINFHYESDGATDAVYKKRGKITIDVNDPPVPVPVIDPDYNAATNFERPSRGIYRPSNMTGPSSPAVGLVYYAWTRSSQDPLSGKEEDNYAAIKRFSLTAKQPREDLYPQDTGLANLNLNVVNNKTNMIAPPAEAFTADGSGTWYLHTWSADMTWDTARELMQYKKTKSFASDFPDRYHAWINEAAGSEADKITYADSKVVAAVAQYDDFEIWKETDFKKNKDSNWKYGVASLLLDNKGPTISMTGLSNDRSANVEVTATISDEHSGLKEAYYQWARKGATPEEIQWKPVVLNGGQFASGTRNEVAEDGEYVLHIKATDMLGNASSLASEPATVDSKATVKGAFVKGTDGVYAQSHDVLFYLNRPETLTVNAVTYSVYTPSVSMSTYGMMPMLAAIPYQVSYAFSHSSVRPEGSSFYTPLNGTAASAGGYEYVIPANKALNGTQYLHVTVKEAAADRYYYFNQAYYFDNQPPAVEFSTEEDLYTRSKQSVSFAASDTLNSVVARKYQWVKKGDAAPDASSVSWTELKDGETASSVDSANLAPGETQDYKLYMYARDKAGNETIVSTTGYFRVSKPIVQPPANARSDLLYVFGDQADGFTAVVQLSLDVLDKTGYEYSVSPDYGKSWLRWRSYTNFVAVQVPSASVQNGQIQVRYKTGPQADGSEGTIGEAKPLDIGSVSGTEPVYALSTLSTDRPVTPTTGVDIDISTPLGIKVVPSAVNPSVPVRTGNRFHVGQNGYYSFDLTDAANPDRKATLYAVVSNIDTTPPTGTIEKVLGGDKTAGNVTVKLKPSEPVRITNNNGSNTYTFKENGTFTFEFLDEAGNSGTAEASVNTIDREGPKVKIARSYTKADGTEYTRIGVGNAELIEGVRLTVEKITATDDEFIVPAGMPTTIYMTANGVAEFTAYDELNNMTIVKETVSNIVGTAPQASEVEYTLVDDEGNALPESAKVIVNGQAYAKGKMKVEIRGQTSAPNRVFLGTAPYRPDPGVEEYPNQISSADGSFVTSRLFTADGTLSIAISDLLGNVNRIPVTVKGLDNKAPELTLNAATIGVARNKPDFDFRKDLGGYMVRDNVSSPEHIQVSIGGLDLTRLGRQTVTYTAVDQVGNAATATQEVVVVGGDGMLIFGNDMLISAASAETAIFESNKVGFKITGFNLMEVSGQKLTNESGTYDLYYYSGLFREGQMKTIATKLTYQELVSGNYEVIFPKTGWYTLIVRNQEREREYATFFISKTE
ncbi:hypothetical protein FE784_31040 [Paenibacillus hemerocallicola]|uniref:DUF5011 domain-containing protein n=1 Tax=Paenibacillus hemerocallicola TaxID=1172614 RepID=A0A5C4T0K3_9BACL|nr:hypothetical protein [Paenibacillus hemerocallicola]TNJ62325.1 hypothetical protein FE784_31040 [Paenibacillus hemerocallicola]